MSKTQTKNQSASFKKKLVATAVASAMMGVSGIAFAQEGVVEEVVVTGIKASLQRAMDIKRESQGVVDSINAEDIGKFPDTNLAESLQRVTGVSIDRSNGEGSKITVRGLGPDFNLVTLNGRQMPTSGLQGTAVNASRSFDFANIASEGIAGVDVYKTSRATIATGGMGATVNVKTTRPLDAPGLKFTAGVKGVYDQSSTDSDLTPEISGLYSQTFADDTIGVAVSVSNQVREGGYRQVSVPDGWHTQGTAQRDGWFGGFDTAGSTTVQDGDQFLRPQNIEYNFTEFRRERNNAQVAFQYKPIDTLKATLDYTYSDMDIASQTNTTNVWFWEGERVNGTTSKWALGGKNNATGKNVYYPIVFTHAGGDDTVFGVGNFAQINENNSVGLNVEWEATDNLTLTLDFHDSDAASKADSPYGNNNVIQTADYTQRMGATVDFSQDFAALGVLSRANPGTYLDGSSFTAASLQPTGSSLRNSIFENDIQQTQLSGNYKFDDGLIKSIDFGAGKTDNNIHRGLMVAQRDNWAQANGNPADHRDEIFTPRSITGDFDAAPGSGVDAFGNTFAQFDRGFIFSFQDAADDVVAVQAPINSNNPVNPAVWPCEDRFCVTNNWTTDQATEETYTSVFAQVNYEYDLGFAVADGSLGVRYEETDVVSSAKVPAYTGIAWTGANEFATVSTPGVFEFTNYEASYDHVLPNFDISLKFENDVVVRGSISETIARANYNDISGGVALGTIRNTEGDASRGDPTLLPHESTNYDLSVEWYYGDASYVSLSAFQKDVDNFVGITTTTETLFDLRNPSAGPRAQAARDAGITDNEQIRQYILANYPETTDGVSRINSVSADPLIQFNVTKPVNERSAEIKGLEFAVQHTLESGFGGQFNYTIVDSDAEYDVTEFDSQFALTGLSDTMNVVAFYETDSFQIRLAYNWRDSFLINTNRQHLNPEFNEEYSQVDLNISYNINEQFSIFAEGLNITDETQRTYSRYKGALQSATELGARYNIGARYTF
uniref:TonB-dependent receptor n=1 Tax=Cellvibrio fontiphilus TaxID=1815559 RepID=UPI002B4BBC6E|nr:TonB-dependent receptor [Cellvibrio fontiphilus]